MKAALVPFGYLTMAGVVISLGWVSYQALVSGFLALFTLVLYTAVATVTDDTANLSVNTLDEVGIICEDFFPCLQRSWLAISTRNDTPLGVPFSSLLMIL